MDIMDIDKLDLIEIINSIHENKQFKIHILCEQELIDLVKGKSFEKAFIREFMWSINILSELGYQAAIYPGKNFRKLNGVPDLCRIRFNNVNYNIRTIYSIKNNSIFLILSFWERAGKNKTNYTPYIKPAQARLEAMKQEVF